MKFKRRAGRTEKSKSNLHGCECHQSSNILSFPWNHQLSQGILLRGLPRVPVWPLNKAQTTATLVPRGHTDVKSICLVIRAFWKSPKISGCSQTTFLRVPGRRRWRTTRIMLKCPKWAQGHPRFIGETYWSSANVHWVTQEGYCQRKTFRKYFHIYGKRGKLVANVLSYSLSYSLFLQDRATKSQHITIYSWIIRLVCLSHSVNEINSEFSDL